MSDQFNLFPNTSTQTVLEGDCLDKMKEMPANSIDFIITDPPYGLHFMGKDWDDATPNSDIWEEALRICKPGAMLAAFGGSRTHHHLMIALEQAGWEIRDVIMWLYGSGFPKSHNKFGLEGYGTALKPAYEPIILAMKPLEGTYKQNVEKWGIGGINIDASRINNLTGQQPSDIIPEKEIIWEQEKYLCPSCANIVISRLKQKVQEIGEYFAIKDVELILKEKGNLHLEDINKMAIGCLLGLFQEELNTEQKESLNLNTSSFGKMSMDQNLKVLLSIILIIMDSTIVLKICNLCQSEIISDIIKVNTKVMLKEKKNMQKELKKNVQGSRWPSNLILDEEAAKQLDEMTGVLKSGEVKPTEDSPFVGIYEHGRKKRNINEFEANSGGASRFFYCAKASRSERNRGLEGLPLKQLAESNKFTDCDYRKGNGEITSKGHQNNHPTVKPISLMKYIINLLAPPNNPILLDPFCGSGSTLLAAKELGINAIGIEKQPEYCEIARARINHAS